MDRTTGRPGTRRIWLRNAVTVCAVALGTFGTFGTLAAPANAAPANAAPANGANAATGGTSGPAARAATPWTLRTPLSETVSTEFWDVAATGAKDAWVVGRKTDGADGPTPAIKHWNGTTWTDVPAAGTGDEPGQLEKVSAAAPDDVWVAGVRLGDTTSPVVVRHWDGEKWADTAHATPQEGWMSFVGDIAAFGEKSAWLTSFDWDRDSGASTSRLERWTGSGWQEVSLPAAPGGGEVRPWDITGTGPDDVWVTAEAVTGDVSDPLLYHWNGRGWTVREVPTPAEHPTGWVANHAVATGRGSVYVVGKTNDAEVPEGTMATQWTGSHWQSLPALPVDEANAAGADGAGKLWIAGWSAGGRHSVLSRWTGTGWATEELPADVTEHSEMSTVSGIAAVPGTNGVFAAGTAGCQSDPVMCGVVVSRDVG
ncbi:hypothetical protein [Streptomyces antimycoticus]|uniref:hypothetical protein n=1 Tax=Streptomyces antimycoticus TaxID=68175 RepID=UPI0036A64E29